MSVTETPKPPRAMHFVANFSGDTVCGKSAAHCRTTRTLTHWNNPTLAGGRRCPKCSAWMKIDLTKQTESGR